ncbi:MAG TPA: hypothetical protein VG870_03105 [Chitinophagaceae bacterium]|nr:hypothetical protein [Chitinophagaceae bacterium]
MKKILVALSLLITCGAFAGEDQVSPRILDAFHRDFANITQVAWSIGDHVFKAEFDLEGQPVAAYYSVNGDLMGMTRNLATSRLPVRLQTSLRKNFESYWVSGLFELANEDGTTYYITLENADQRVVLRSLNGGNWSVYQKRAKA